MLNEILLDTVLWCFSFYTGLFLLKSGGSLDYKDGCQNPAPDSCSAEDKNTVDLHAKNISQELI